MRKYWHLWAILGVALVAVAILVVGWPWRLGLDLKGGVHVVLQAEDTATTKVTPEVMDRARAVVERRVNGLGVSEAVVQIQGERRLVVELPGVTDQQEALRVIGRTAVLEFRDPQGNVLLTGADLKRSTVEHDQLGLGWVVALEFTPEGGRKFEAATRRLVGQKLYIYLDKDQLSDPQVREPIAGGRAIIEGGFTATSARNLSVLLNAGSLPVPLKQLEIRNVGATLGQDSIRASFIAGIVGALGVLLFMALVYRIPGLVADLALVLYILIDLAALVALRATFTVPGLAGFILSVGMAVDANVIIFERVKDELRAGKAGRAAVEAGFSRAFTAIVDSNVTTIIAALVLYFLGTGPIKGFAITLTVGILASMFTAVVVSHALLRLLVDRQPERVPGYFGEREAVA